MLSNRKNTVRRIEEKTSERDRKLIERIKKYLLKVKNDLVEECDNELLPIAVSRFYQRELEKTQNSQTTTQLLDEFEKKGYFFEIDKNGVCTFFVKDKEFKIEDVELRDLIEKLDIYEKDDSIYSTLKPIQINIIRNLYLNPSGVELDEIDLQDRYGNKKIPEYYIYLQNDRTLVVEFDGQRHCLPYKYSRHILNVKDVLMDRQKFIDEINSKFSKFMNNSKSRRRKPSCLKIMEDLVDLKSEENSSIEITFDGEKYYCIDSKTGNIVYLDEEQSDYLKKLPIKVFKYLYNKNKVTIQEKGCLITDYQTHITLKQLFDLGFKFKVIKSKNGEATVKITDPFGRVELTPATEWANMHMPYTNRMINYAKHYGLHTAIGKGFSLINYHLGNMVNRYEPKAIAMEPKNALPNNGEIIEEDGTIIDEEETIQQTDNRDEISELHVWLDYNYNKEQFAQTLKNLGSLFRIARTEGSKGIRQTKSKGSKIIKQTKSKVNIFLWDKRMKREKQAIDRHLIAVERKLSREESKNNKMSRTKAFRKEYAGNYEKVKYTPRIPKDREGYLGYKEL